jgi:hypothetical protein
LGLSAAPGGQAALAAGMAADNLAMAVFLSALMVAKAEPPETKKEKAFASWLETSAGDDGNAGGNEARVTNGGVGARTKREDRGVRARGGARVSRVG